MVYSPAPPTRAEVFVEFWFCTSYVRTYEAGSDGLAPLFVDVWKKSYPGTSPGWSYNS